MDELKQAFTYAFAAGFKCAEETSRQCTPAMDDVWETYSALRHPEPAATDERVEKVGHAVLQHKVFAEARQRHLHDATQSGMDHHLIVVAAEHGARAALAALKAEPAPADGLVEAREKLRSAWLRVQTLKRQPDLNVSPLQPIWDAINAIPGALHYLDDMPRFEADLEAEDQQDRIKALEAALVEARGKAIEECAKVAERYNNWDYVRRVDDYNWEPGSPYDRGQQHAAKTIAQAIRSLSEGE